MASVQRLCYMCTQQIIFNINQCIQLSCITKLSCIKNFPEIPTTMMLLYGMPYSSSKGALNSSERKGWDHSCVAMVHPHIIRVAEYTNAVIKRLMKYTEASSSTNWGCSVRPVLTHEPYWTELINEVFRQKLITKWASLSCSPIDDTDRHINPIPVIQNTLSAIILWLHQMSLIHVSVLLTPFSLKIHYFVQVK